MKTNTFHVTKLLFLFFMLLMPLLANAKVIVSGIGYELMSENNTAKVTSGNSSYVGDIVIPSTIVYQGSSYMVTEIGFQAFAYCKNLTSVSMPEGLTTIENSAFRACTKLTSVAIPSSVEKIGQEAFYYCKSLASLIIPQDSKLKTIGSYAFEDCDSLVSVFIPSNVEEIGMMAFSGISNLFSLVVDEQNKFYDSRSNCNAIIETRSNKLISGCSTTIIPKGITSIEENAFRECLNLTSITIPQGVSEICYQAFLKCEHLASVIILEGTTSIGMSAFKDCTSLTSIILPENVTNIGNYAFKNCSALTDFEIPVGVTSLGYEVFYGCSSLASITCKATIPPTVGNSDTFEGVSKSIPVYVPAVSVDAYKAANGWSEFANYQSMIVEYTLSMSAAEYATLYLSYDAEIPESVKAYIATSVEDDCLKMKQVTGVLPAGTGVIVRAKEGTYTFVESENEPANVEGNLLRGTAAKETITTESGYKYYVLAQKEGVVAMYKPMLTDGQFINNANKAYLALKMDDLGIFDDETNTEDEGGQLSNRLRFDFGETTDIEKTTDDEQQATIIYDLHGRRITDVEGFKGLYIINGRKVVLK